MKPLRSLISFLYGLYAWLMTLVLLPPMWLVSIALPGMPARRRFASFTIRTIAFAIGSPIRVVGLENLPEVSSIVVANHISYLDGPMMLVALPPRFSFVVKAEASRVPVIAMLLRRMGCTFVSRDNAAQGSADTRRLMRALKSGQSLGLFPEGHIQRTPGLQPFRLGAFLIAAHCAAPVVPVAIRGTRAFLPRNQWWPRRSSFEIRLLPPIFPDDRGREAAQRLLDQAYNSVLAQCEEPAASTAVRPAPG